MLTSENIIEYMEHVLLGIIIPSNNVGRTLMPGVFILYRQWAELRDLVSPFTERPFSMEIPRGDGYLFRCNFDGIDISRFPTVMDLVDDEEDSGNGS